MQIWTMWLDTLREVLQFLATDLGLGAGLAIVVLTLLVRGALLPVSWSLAYRACIRQKRLRQLQPELQRLRERLKDQPQRLMQETMETYRRHGLAPFDGASLLGGLAQSPVLLGMYQVLRQSLASGRFLWIGNLTRPDTLIALAAALAMALTMAVNPDLPEQTRALMIALPALLTFVFALKFASALALYWVVSNCVTAAQTFAVHALVGRRLKSGTLHI